MTLYSNNGIINPLTSLLTLEFMDTDKTYKVGDKVVCGGFLYRIFKVDVDEAIIFFRPYFKTNKNSSTVRKIPVVNISQTTIRQPITKQQVKEIIDFLREKKIEKGFIDLNVAKETLMQNDFFGAVKVLKWLWQDRQVDEKNFTFSKKRVYDMATERIVEEIAYVQDLSIEEAEGQIFKHLKSSVKH